MMIMPSRWVGHFSKKRKSPNSRSRRKKILRIISFLIVDYEQSNFSISQAVFDPSTPSHIISLTSNSTTGGPGPSSPAGNGTVVKSPQSSSSHGIKTGAIAGIAIAIVLIAVLCSGYFIRRYLRRHKRDKLNTNSIIEVEAPKVVPEDDEDSKRDFTGDLEVKKPVAATVTVNEAQSPMTPPSEVVGSYFFDGGEKHQVQSRAIELPGSPGSPPNRSELSTPEPWQGELENPDVVRSELSTPDPCYNHPELPSPNPSHELGSPSMSSVSSGQPSPPLYEDRRSAFHSPAQLAFQRPLSERMDSSESEAGLTRDGMPRHSFHRRYQSNDSLNPSMQSRPQSSRVDSSDSEGWIHSNRVDESSESEPIVSPVNNRPNLTHLDSSDSEAAISAPSDTSQVSRPRPAAVRADSSSESEAPSPSPSPNRQVRGLVTPFHSSSSFRPAIRRSMVHRPFSFRTNSSDSDAWQTRLDSASTENPSDFSRFPSLRQPRDVNNRVLEESDESLSEGSEGGGRR